MTAHRRGELPTAVDALLPTFDVESRHSIDIAAPPEVVYGCARELDLSASWLVRALLLLRGIGPASTREGGGFRKRFVPLWEEPPHGFALGLIGRFWTLRGGLVDCDADGFRGFDRPGFAKVVWSFDLSTPEPGRTHLRTVTRIRALDADARRSFRRYWAVVGPFSGIVRGRLLASIRAASEGPVRGTHPAARDRR